MSCQYKKKRLSRTETRDEHRLVMEKYLERPLEHDEVVHHINGDSRDNRIGNLELMTRSTHAKIHLTGKQLSIAHISKLKYRTLSHFGSSSPQSKLNEVDIPVIINMINFISIRKIAMHYHVNKSTITDIRDGRTWKHVQPPIPSPQGGPMPNPDSIISFCCRLSLARELGVEPSELEFIGVQPGLSFDLILFNVLRKGPGYKTTRAVRIDKCPIA